MNTKIELLIKLTELSEQIRHSKKHSHRHEDKDCNKTKRHHSHDCGCEKSDKSDRGRGRNKLSFTAKRTLCILLEEESINQRSISKMLGVSAQTVSEMIKNLENKEIIVKTQGEINNENFISLTESGKETALETSKRITERADKTFSGLTQEEIKVLGVILDKIGQNNLNYKD